MCVYVCLQPSSAIVTEYNVRVAASAVRAGSGKKGRRRSVPAAAMATLDAIESDGEASGDDGFDLTNRTELKKLSTAVASRLAKTQVARKSADTK